eukprot:Sdes_comp12816_c0_seq1m3017
MSKPQLSPSLVFLLVLIASTQAADSLNQPSSLPKKSSTEPLVSFLNDTSTLSTSLTPTATTTSLPIISTVYSFITETYNVTQVLTATQFVTDFIYVTATVQAPTFTIRTPPPLMILCSPQTR